MARLIDADALEKNLSNDLPYKGSVKRVLIQAPTVEAEPVRHGKWIEHKYAEEHGGQMISNWECSECNTWFKSTKKYCGECGAKMDGD